VARSKVRARSPLHSGLRPADADPDLVHGRACHTSPLKFLGLYDYIDGEKGLL
jgi:hypothetical protein